MAALDQPGGSRIDVTDGALLPRKGEKHIVDSWRLTIAFAFLGIMTLVFIAKDPFDQIFQVIIKGAPLTFGVTAGAIMGSVVLGLFTGLGQIARARAINLVAGVYVELIRGIPLLVQLIFIYFALGKFFQLDGIPAAIIALSICYGAYMGEIFRAGIQSIPKGQMEAALALGLTRGQAMRYIILPQTMKIILPAIGNEFIAMLKDSSLISVIALRDILRRGREHVARTFLSLETYAMVALVYLVFTLVLSKLVALMEDRMKKNER
ncbi:MAG: amino acid ABC transporter permease [Spirochaetaceae bacterium]|nr:amino acid ABC transporter permease [Spirochaetaceae bacterium]MDT8297746.1 amino acid ABC transporter permease [Spirochaetaceae bacterium]